MNIPAENLLYKERNGEMKLCISYSQLSTFIDCPYRWYKTYLLGQRSTTKHEATSYGTCIHLTMEHFFKTGRCLTRQQLCDTFCYYAEKEEIPFDSLWNQLKGHADSMKMINWLCDIYERDKNGEFIKPKAELNEIEYILRMSDIAGVEEEFELPYKLPVPININGKDETEVLIIGSLDLHLEKNGFHTIIDWKSDNKGSYNEEHLKTNLQFPIYSMYLSRKYNVLPNRCAYIHTRTNKFEYVKVDKQKILDSAKEVSNTLKRMYSWGNGWAHKLLQENPGSDIFELVKVADPKPLCYWCDFSKTSGDNSCKSSSSWIPKEKR